MLIVTHRKLYFLEGRIWSANKGNLIPITVSSYCLIPCFLRHVKKWYLLEMFSLWINIFKGGY